ncbi:MAG TPA: GatB/YqeY domain-containing protein [Candidatus Ligilactobacillus excrementipullorum]|nr:GatB/YqeY domain-containing protein [Candidatus Ligilactobacillus excrementipullorum]
MSLLDTLQKDMITAMKAKDKEKLSTVRMLKAAATNEKINLGRDLNPDEEVSVLSHELKQRKDSLAEFKAADRPETVAQLENEIKIVESYMPTQLSADEVQQIVATTIAEVHAESTSDFGKVMGAVMPKVKGQADGKLVNSTVNELLSK